MYPLGLVAVGVVILSWRVPEPAPPAPGVGGIAPVAFTECTAPENAPPSYGTRSVNALDHPPLGAGCLR